MPKVGLRTLALFGFAMTIVGFLWGGLFAGVPYQDPTPEQQANHAFHANGGFWLFCFGLALAVLGCVGLAFKWLLSRRNARQRL